MQRYKARASQVRSRKRLLIAAGVILLLVIIVITGIVFGNKAAAPVNDSASVAPEANEPRPEAVVGRYLFNGTAVLARAVERSAGSDLSQPFSKMNTFEPEKYDAMTLDWECPTTDDVIPYATQVSNLLFNCHTKWLPEVSKLFTIVSLANNHSNDLGAEAFAKTIDNLEDAGIQTYGHHDPSLKDESCQIIALPVRIKQPDGTQEPGKLPMAFCAWHYFFRTPQPGEIEAMQQYAEVMPVFGFMHAGAEYFAKAAPDQEFIARKIIDLGAEFVIGNSPHWVQNGEVYKGKPIFYSTGNFIFDQIDNETMRGLSIDVSIEVPFSDDMSEWLSLGESCTKRRDDCLEQISQRGLKKFDIKLTYDVVGSSGGAHRVTQKADPVLQKAIEQRVGWPAMKAQL